MDFRASEVNAGVWLVHVAPSELVVDSGKLLPYATCIGTIDSAGKINVWTPAASKPRGYRATAQRMLEEARETLRARGDLDRLPPRVWHAVVNSRTVVDAYSEENLSAAQEHAARLQRAYPEHTIRVEQIRQERRPLKGDFFKGQV